VSDQEERQRFLPEDAALRAIIEGVEAETGDQFFHSLVRHLASALGVQYAFVSELTADRQAFRTLALWVRGAVVENVTVPLDGTPCESVLQGEMSHHPENLAALFPRDTVLADWKAVSYCGVPLVDRSGTVAGHLAIIDDKPMHDGPRGVGILRIFAARALAEVERLRTEDALRASEERLARILDSAMDAIVTIDEDRRIAIFNAAAEKFFRCPAAEAIGQPLDRFLTAELRESLEASMRAVAAGGQMRPYVYAPEGLRARDASGREFPVEGTISRVEVASRPLFTLILRDVEERQRAEKELGELHQQNVYLLEEIKSVHNFDEIIGRSRTLAAALDKVDLVAATDSSVLILGETGTGKELIARAVHSRSARRKRPLIKVNCASLPAGLVESELFGHERGAFTGATDKRIGRFELADGGTIFLDEVGELSPEVQVKLLRVLQEREFERVGGSKTIAVDVRMIAATNRDLAQAVAAGKFREDLYYRLNVFPVHLPPLRDRREDIPLLVHYFVDRYATKIGRTITRVPEDSMQRLQAYGWPGNVRELENVVERAVILSPGPDLVVAPEALPVAAEAPAAKPVATAVDGLQPSALNQVERQHIVTVLKQTGWRIDGPSGAARLLNMNSSTLRSRMQKLGIRRSAEGGS
jgi:PAS domain S-box-containing protein